MHFFIQKKNVRGASVLPADESRMRRGREQVLRVYRIGDQRKRSGTGEVRGAQESVQIVHGKVVEERPEDRCSHRVYETLENIIGCRSEIFYYEVLLCN